ncbi:MAG: hypothetical protein OEY84_05570 [Rhodospirillaceae bacterium]|nr:hypothetical protein [Rhodospirillaceae bacterium]MDH5772585.1 hypothetical protein [Rhodospirillaceae bacterium]
MQKAGSRTMMQIFGVIGFFMAVLAIFLVSETIRRSNHRMLELETAFYKLSGRIQQLELRMAEVEKDTGHSAAERRRQTETLLALEKKTRTQRTDTTDVPSTGIASSKENEQNERYVPSQYKKTLGIG